MALPPPATDRTCIVTGVSSGIGAELARRLADPGYGVTLVARREDRLAALAGEAADVAPHGLEVLITGRAVVVPGALNKVSDLGGEPTPRSVLLPLVKRAWPALGASQSR